MNRTDHAIYLEWLDLESEGVLPAAEGRRLEAHLADCADCRDERRRIVALHEMLAAARVPVADGFRQRVVDGLPAAPWERSVAAPRRWLAAGLLVGLLGALSAVLIAISGAHLAAGGSLLGAVAAVGDMVATAAIAGAGLLGASWAGIGLVVGDLFRRSPGTLVAVALLALFLAALTVSLLRRPRAAERRVDR